MRCRCQAGRRARPARGCRGRRRALVERHRPEGDRARLHAERLAHKREELAQRLALHREETKVDLRGVVGLERVVVPFDLFERERDLLACLKGNQSCDGLRISRRKLDEAGQSAVAEPRVVDRDVLSRQLLLARELRERLLEDRLRLRLAAFDSASSRPGVVSTFWCGITTKSRTRTPSPTRSSCIALTAYCPISMPHAVLEEAMWCYLRIKGPWQVG